MYEDTNANGTYEAGSDAQITSATLGSPTANYATLTPASVVTIPSTGKTFFVIVNISLSATINDVVKLQVDNPSTDITFSDAYADDLAGADYACVPAGRPYTQAGYLTGSSATPTTGNSTTIDLQTTPQPPIVTSIVPGNSATDVSRSTTVVATFSKNMKASTINNTNFKLFDGPTETAGTVTFDGTITATFTPSSPLSWGTTYTATIYGNGASGVQDNVNNLYMASNKVWSFTTVFAVNPTVLSTSPLNATIEVPRSTTGTATFSKAMNPATITTSTFTLFDGTSYVTGTVGYDAPSRTATFTQTSPPLAWGTVYTASITTGATDTDGLALQSAHTWTFTTTAPVYPLVSVTSPANGQSEVPRTDNVQATFSKDMNSASVIANFKLYDSGSNLVAGTVSWDGPSWTATLDPTPTLNWGETYTAKVLVAAMSADGLPMLADKVWTFTTTMPVYPTVTLTSPANGDNEVSRSSTVSATFSKAMTGATVTGAFTLKDHLGNTVAGSGVYDGPSKTLTFTPGAALLWGETYTARMTTAATATDGLALQSDKVWTFATTMPVYPMVTLTSPANGDNEVSRSATVSATFSKDMNSASVIANFKLYDSGSNLVAGTVSWDGPNWTVTLDPTPTLNWGEMYTARITTAATATDGLAMQSAKVWVFTTTMPVYPIVNVTTPLNGASEVLRDATVTATFSKSMVEGSVEAAGVFTLKDHDGNTVAGAVDYVDATKTVTLTPGSTLLWGEAYTARITTAATATDGLALQADKVWTFTTTIPVYPTVLNKSPAGNSKDVPRVSTVSVVFSKDMDPSSITTSTFGVKKGATPVPGNVTYNAGSRTAAFTPSLLLDWGTTYTVTVVSGGSGVKALDGLAMQPPDATWTFETVQPVNPVVVNTSPAPGMTDVVPTTVVTATFSRIMKASTITGTSLLLKDSIGAPVAGVVSFDDTTTATFTPSASLLPGATYTATVTTAVWDADDLPMLADRVWSFTTSPRPAVLSVSPASGAVGVSRSASIKIVFSKDVASTTWASAVVLKDATGAPVACNPVSYDGTTYTATLAPSAELAFAPYTVTVAAGASGVKDGYGIEMAANVTWSFTTIPAVDEPVAANNRIVPGSSAPVTVFIPQPPAGASDKVTVQVFTTTGKRVATLVNAKPYSELLAELPLLWDGTNGRTQKLGPGLYFIRISATGWVRTLKVMIVR